MWSTPYSRAFMFALYLAMVPFVPYGAIHLYLAMVPYLTSVRRSKGSKRLSCCTIKISRNHNQVSPQNSGNVFVNIAYCLYLYNSSCRLSSPLTYNSAHSDPNWVFYNNCCPPLEVVDEIRDVLRLRHRM